MRAKLLILLVLLAVILLVVGWAVTFLWSKLGLLSIPILIVLIGLSLWGLKVAVIKGLTKMMEAPFKAKGAALRGATAVVHSVNSTRLPSGHRQLVVDATIKPSPEAPGPFASWEAGEVQIVPKGTKPTDDSDEPELQDEDIQDESGLPRNRTEILDNNVFVRDEGMKYTGDLRIRIYKVISGSNDDYVFGYYFETFGNVRVPK